MMVHIDKPDASLLTNQEIEKFLPHINRLYDRDYIQFINEVATDMLERENKEIYVQRNITYWGYMSEIILPYTPNEIIKVKINGNDMQVNKRANVHEQIPTLQRPSFVEIVFTSFVTPSNRNKYRLLQLINNLISIYQN